MLDADKPPDDLVREMYARFGFAYYQSDVLHRGLCNILATIDLPQKDLITRPRIVEQFAHAFSLTLGAVIKELRGKLPNEFSARLEDVLEKRNFLAHHFWSDRVHLMFHVDHIYQLINELDGYTELFNRLDEEISHWAHRRLHDLGVTDEMLQKSLNRILSGEREKPLPPTKAVKELDKKLKGTQRLIRVWEFEVQEGGKPLIFEMHDGSLWQLCDVGLGWTQFQNTEPNWIEHPAFQPYLPADITPRPKNIKPWEYEFILKAGAAFWVKPGTRPKTFQWGIRTRNKNS